MGDRANIKITETPYQGPSPAPIYLYSHWGGHDYPEALRQALADARGRWGDAPYCNRLIIRSLFADLSGDTGGGVSTYLADNDRPVIELHHAGGDGWVGLEGGSRRFTFQEYVDLPEATWATFGSDGLL